MLPQLLRSYNKSMHKSIKTKPLLVTKKNEKAIWHTLYGQTLNPRVNFKFQVGDQVRISKMKRTFDKDIYPNELKRFSPFPNG